MEKQNLLLVEMIAKQTEIIAELQRELESMRHYSGPNNGHSHSNSTRSNGFSSSQLNQRIQRATWDPSVRDGAFSAFPEEIFRYFMSFLEYRELLQMELVNTRYKYRSISLDPLTLLVCV